MLSELIIENIAVIDKASIRFTEGFNCLTGETGAGKSIIIDAINCIIGNKTPRELIRSGEQTARVTAVFCGVSEEAALLLSSNDIDYDGGELIVSRKITRDGRNSCRVNSSPVTVGFLRTLGDRLVNIHGQMDSKNLLDSEKHFYYIDLFGKTKEYIDEYKKDYKNLCDIRNEIKRLSMDESEKLKEIDMLDFRIEELSAADLKSGEREELTARREVYRNAEKIASALSAVSELLNGDGDSEGAASLVGSAAETLDSVGDFLRDEADTVTSLRDMAYSLEEIGNDIQQRLESVSYSESELNAVEERIDFLNRLSRKYGDTEDDMLRYLEESVKRREEIELADDRLSELNELFDTAAEKAKKSAKALSKIRRENAEKFSEAVIKELRFLDMPDVSFYVEDKIIPLGENGVDNMCFMFSANRGEEPKPLSKIASGGELSRVMLAIKNVLSECDSVGTLIFDEIDTGVSGRAAEKIAMKLYEVSLGRQVVCVTHLSQLACFADSHFLIEKRAEEDRTFTSVKKLDDEQRAFEIARIVGGANIASIQIDNARQLMENACEYKRKCKDNKQ